MKKATTPPGKSSPADDELLKRAKALASFLREYPPYYRDGMSMREDIPLPELEDAIRKKEGKK